MNKRRTVRIAFSSLAVAGVAFAGAVPAHAEANSVSDSQNGVVPDSAFVIEWKSGPTGIEVTPRIPPLVLEWK
ncbi:hypothetical protein AMK16_32940 [Streptomyces sp. CB00455]|uniref:hypothetical protein n=1 Tax=Streptomyces sp. CB00455 TaxID=1703927 RepID=UPI00093AF3D6|nr:hypothetical protein [Streptomyces sp. CB00455]OKK11119.1 hypothetical protein AMK16_32940 [Streptomyces sp. CB00455]